MNNQINMLDGLLPHTTIPNPQVLINVVVPYLDSDLDEVLKVHTRPLIAAALSIVYSKYTTPAQTGIFKDLNIRNDSPAELNKFIDNIDEYENTMTTNIVTSCVDYDEQLDLNLDDRLGSSSIDPLFYQTQRNKREMAYEELVERLVVLFNESLITNPIENCESENEILLNAFEKYNEIIVCGYSYYPNDHRLSLIIES